MTTRSSSSLGNSLAGFPLPLHGSNVLCFNRQTSAYAREMALTASLAIGLAFSASGIGECLVYFHSSMIREFGNAWPQIKPLLIAGSVISAAVTSFFVGLLLYTNRIEDLLRILPVTLLIGAVVPLFVAPTLLFSIRFEDGYIMHRLCRRWTLARKSLSELTRLGGGGTAAVIFYFVDGSKIRFIGAHAYILNEMHDYIHELRPDLGS